MNLRYLLFLACPVGMGLMMWMMMRGQGQQPMGGRGGVTTRTSGDDEASRLRGQLQGLQEQETAIKAEIEQLSAERPLAGHRQ